MPSSVVVALRKAIRDGLNGLTGAGGALEGVSVSYAWDPSPTDRYQIFTVRATGDQDPAGLKAGRLHRNEDGRLQLVVQVTEPGGSQEEADETAIAFGQVVEEFLADRKSNELGVSGLNWVRVDSWVLDGGPGDGSSVSVLTYSLLYNARLT